MESIFYGGKTSFFFWAKNLSVNTWWSGPDICSLICDLNGVSERTRQKKATSTPLETLHDGVKYFPKVKVQIFGEGHKNLSHTMRINPESNKIYGSQSK